ncbi:hypothetical protein M9Y10_031380 [Tritrichomonas musculus]|uniref:GOLD domain-containing protein n=1 Tax=Tritrichomonas musculus TaxID=1915356 RepID=A0ABR2H0F8_9EUKA
MSTSSPKKRKPLFDETPPINRHRIQRAKTINKNSKKYRDEIRYVFHRTDHFETFHQKTSLFLPVELSPNRPVLAWIYKMPGEIQEVNEEILNEPQSIEIQASDIKNPEEEEEKNSHKRDEGQFERSNEEIFLQEEEEENDGYNEKADETKNEEENDVFCDIRKKILFEEEECDGFIEKVDTNNEKSTNSEAFEDDIDKFFERESINDFLSEPKSEIQFSEGSIEKVDNDIHTIDKSSIKYNVQKQGGNVDGCLRFSIQWNDTGTLDKNDLDAHCIEPNGYEIMYNSRQSFRTHGVLDIDVQEPKENEPACENIVWQNKKKMIDGKYSFFVRNYEGRNGKGGFRAEIEIEGQIYSYDYRKTLKNKEDVYVAEVTLNKGIFSINHLISFK